MILTDINKVYRGGSKSWLMALSSKFALEACILEAGDGDYLEIGVNRGGSLVFAALVKKMLGQKGSVYGIEASVGFKEHDDKLAKDMGVDIHVIYRPSYPWPPEAEEIEPVVAFIDGDHCDEAPMKDWFSLRDRTKRFILFHDCDAGSAVEKVVDWICNSQPNWKLVGKSGHMAVFERCESS